MSYFRVDFFLKFELLKQNLAPQTFRIIDLISNLDIHKLLILWLSLALDRDIIEVI